jgi:uncharacterized membrane protein AbrB (regulator of aidB expression)
MNRSTTRLVITIVLVVYGVYVASYVPGMLVGPPAPVLLVAFALQAVLALAAAVGVWRRQGWAAGVVMLLGISIAATWLVEAFVLGIVAYLRAFVIAVIALVVAAGIAWRCSIGDS